jgi:NADPH-dependent 2,4-dienoyl-CoA reductase/sulfur reductase-like enzyme
MRIEHWSNAVEQGQAAARTLLHGRGEDTAFKSVPSFWSDHFGIRLQSVGALQLADEWEVVAGELETRQFIVAAKRQGRLVGAVTYGMGRKLAPYRIKLTRPEPLEAVTQ